MVWEKNGQDIRAILSGRMSRFLRPSNSKKQGVQIPVFVFHSVVAVRFEKQLKYLAENGYTTVHSDSLLEILKGSNKSRPKTVALTFDDATWSFWNTAFPLLKKYGFSAILFAIPGLVPEDNETYPNLEDVWAGRTTFEEIIHREHMQPLCTWSELLAMHKSGIVDIQSHSLTHSRINISPKVVDFINPEFDTYFYENVNIPVSRTDSSERPLRPVRFGEPVYQSASKLSGHSRFLENPYVFEKMVDYVEQNGGKDFFLRSSWRRALNKKYRELTVITGKQTEYDRSQETEVAIWMEFIRSKELLENRLHGKTISHFCYPWFQGCTLSDRIAAECGYNSVFYGLENRPNGSELKKVPFRIRRISEDYLFCLPGSGQHEFFNVWLKKIAHFAGK